jgi:hypothetical protein
MITRLIVGFGSDSAELYGRPALVIWPGWDKPGQRL